MSRKSMTNNEKPVNSTLENNTFLLEWSKAAGEEQSETVQQEQEKSSKQPTEPCTTCCRSTMTQGPNMLYCQNILCLTSTNFCLLDCLFCFSTTNLLILLVYLKTEETLSWMQVYFWHHIKLLFVKTKITLLNNFPFSFLTQRNMCNSNIQTYT